VPAVGGLENAVAAAEALRCDCFQLFVKNQRQWRARPLSEDGVRRFREAHQATAMGPVVAHASYLLNLASPVEAIRRMSVEAMIEELQRCEALGVEMLVFHPGAHTMRDVGAKRQPDEGLSICDCRLSTEPKRDRRRGASGVAIAPRFGSADPSRDRQRDQGGSVDPAAPRRRGAQGEGADNSRAMLDGITRIATSLDEVHARCAGFRTTILLEGTAGQGTSIGWRFEQLRGVLERVREHERLGVCLDTCHLFAAGYDIRTPRGYAAAVDELESVIGVARVKCIHMNDSKCPLGSRVDRHEHIGKGLIGKSGFANFLNDPRFAGVPMILETPKGVDGRGANLDTVNLKRLRALVH
jgi:endonuclease IV